jgi:hypothetical protein
MPDYDDDEIPDAPGRGPIIVRRPVYNERMKMLEEAKPEDGPPFEAARGMAQDYEASGEPDKVDSSTAQALP